MDKTKFILTLIAIGIIIGVVITLVLIFVIGAKPSKVIVGPVEFEMPTAPPEPRNTVAPSTATPSASSWPDHGELLFEDNFDDNSNRWILVEQDDFWIADGFYHLSLNEKGGPCIYSEEYFDELRNFVYEAAFYEVSGGSSCSYWLVFRAHHPGEHWYQRTYSFEVVPKQQVYNIERVDLTISETGSGWPSPLMRRGYVPEVDWQETSHTLTVVARENQFTFYIDGQFINTLEDEDDLYQKGTIGFGAQQAHIAVDYVRVWSLPQ